MRIILAGTAVVGAATLAAALMLRGGVEGGAPPLERAETPGLRQHRPAEVASPDPGRDETPRERQPGPLPASGEDHSGSAGAGRSIDESQPLRTTTAELARAAMEQLQLEPELRPAAPSLERNVDGALQRFRALRLPGLTPAAEHAGAQIFAELWREYARLRQPIRAREAAFESQRHTLQETLQFNEETAAERAAVDRQLKQIAVDRLGRFASQHLPALTSDQRAALEQLVFGR